MHKQSYFRKGLQNWEPKVQHLLQTHGGEQVEFYMKSPERMLASIFYFHWIWRHIVYCTCLWYLKKKNIVQILFILLVISSSLFSGSSGQEYQVSFRSGSKVLNKGTLRIYTTVIFASLQCIKNSNDYFWRKITWDLSIFHMCKKKYLHFSIFSSASLRCGSDVGHHAGSQLDSHPDLQ